MLIFRSSRCRFGVTLFVLPLVALACTVSAKNSIYFGKIAPPSDQVLRYVTGDEPESLDPQVSTGQPETRIYMALFEGLVEYDPKTSGAIPAIAERWDVNNDLSEFTFHLRKDARFSNNDPITARDFVYTFRRGLSPELASRSAYLAYYIKYGQEYNEGGVFVRDPQTGQFLLEQNFQPGTAGATPSQPLSSQPGVSISSEYQPTAQEPTPDRDTPFHQFMHSPARLVVPGDEKARAKRLATNPKLKAALAGKEFVPVKAEDIGVEAVDDYTLRVSLVQSAPFFVGLMAHQLFRVIEQKVVEKYGGAWTQPANIVCSGPFKLESWRPYNDMAVVRNPMYWDAANVKLDRIIFYPMSDNPTIMNLYKAGDVDAVLNHTVPGAWLDVVRPMKDYMDAPEDAIDFYLINTTKPPMNDARVRHAFNMAIDKTEWVKWRKIVKPCNGLVPEGIFPGYPQPKGDPFDPEKAKQLLAQAGYKDAAGHYDPKKFPVDQVEIVYNVQESNKLMAEFTQAQWKQNLGITVPLRAMEWKTFIDARAKLEYKGFARGGWIGDYMDPFTFLSLYYTPTGDNGTGWWDQKYVDMLDEANRTLDPQKRYGLLGKAEAYALEAQPTIPFDTASVNWVKKPYVKGMYPNPADLYPWKFVYVEHDPTKWDYGTPKLAD